MQLEIVVSCIIYNFTPKLIKLGYNCCLFVVRTGTGDTRTQDSALTADFEPAHPSQHAAIMPG
jgi:hypothetical protein